MHDQAMEAGRLTFMFAFLDRRRPDNEVDWLPSEAAVAKARARLERRGIVLGRKRSLATGSTGLQGETPWRWWAAAVLWVLLWPLTLASKFVGGQLAWLPWWMPLPLSLVHMGLLAWPVWRSEREARLDDTRRRFAKVQTLDQIMALEPAEFEAWTALLFQLMGYQVNNTQDVADHGIDLTVSNSRIRFGLVQCKRHRATVGEPAVRDLYGTMIHENADYAWLVTTGGISRQALQWASGKPIELWDGRTLETKARRLRS